MRGAQRPAAAVKIAFLIFCWESREREMRERLDNGWSLTYVAQHTLFSLEICPQLGYGILEEYFPLNSYFYEIIVHFFQHQVKLFSNKTFYQTKFFYHKCLVIHVQAEFRMAVIQQTVRSSQLKSNLISRHHFSDMCLLYQFHQRENQENCWSEEMFLCLVHT